MATKRNVMQWMIGFVFMVWVLGLAGCWPEDSMEWSGDGSVGLIRTGDNLLLMQGSNQTPSLFTKEEVLPGPTLSQDGQWIAYVIEKDVNELAEGLSLLLPTQVRQLEQHATEMRDLVQEPNVPHETEFPRLTEKGYEENYRSWIVRLMCERADDALKKKLGPQRYNKGKNELSLTLYELYVVRRDNPVQKKRLLSSLRPMLFLRFSPDVRSLAYMMAPLEEEHYSYSLCVASLQDDERSSVGVAEQAACICDWSEDSQRLAYFATEKSSEGGVLTEAQVVDEKGQLLAQALDPNQPAWTSHAYDGKPKELAGVLFDPWTKVQYGPQGRILFSSVSLSLPSSVTDDPQWSVFCYDPATTTVVNLIPAKVRQSLGESLRWFSLSPDKKNLLLGGEDIVIFCLNRDREFTLIETGAEVDHDSGMLPAWKGNDQISCLVGEESKLLKDKEYTEDQLVLLNLKGEVIKVITNE